MSERIVGVFDKVITFLDSQTNHSQDSQKKRKKENIKLSKGILFRGRKINV